MHGSIGPCEYELTDVTVVYENKLIWTFIIIIYLPLNITKIKNTACRLLGEETSENHLAPVVRKVDNAIHWINHYPVDSMVFC